MQASSAQYHHCQISDFGMSRGVEDENYLVSRGGKIPVKWTAPEVHMIVESTSVHYKDRTSTEQIQWNNHAGTSLQEVLHCQ